MCCICNNYLNKKLNLKKFYFIHNDDLDNNIWVYACRICKKEYITKYNDSYKDYIIIEKYNGGK